ncbi:hypothetical protein [Rhizobium tubonense]|uniref:Uncharacterized protein n=1 Tax=Rhizobium tubonense TaxID=484088 RepID=A0A2W4D0A3_9HYPH|nr:hypothetical protein [Rhizobium tubonense]PZM15705.1 hypothetical protein CPY51_05915 [Rhizobium tubonense]
MLDTKYRRQLRNDNLDNDFLALAGFHAKTVQNAEDPSQSPDDNDTDRALAHAIEEERSARAAIIRFEPSSRVEAQTKLLYLVFFLASTKASLDSSEMTAVMASISHLQN